jgi:hypothetical protein
MASETSFLNVDLDIQSKQPLDRLVTAFGERVRVLHVGKVARHFEAHIELARSGYQRNPNPLIRRFVELIATLPPSARQLWTSATLRQFNLGFQAGSKPPAYEVVLDPLTLESVWGMGAEVVITIYAPE